MLSARVVLGSLVCVAGLVVGSPTALAHNAVLNEDPERDSVVTVSPLPISVTTNDALLDLMGEGQGNQIAVTNEAGEYFGDGCVTLGTNSLEALVPLGEAGVYTITYQFVSADGHSVSDSYQITFEPGSSHVPAMGQPSLPLCGEEPVVEETPMEESHEESSEPMVIATADNSVPDTTNPWLVAAGSTVAASALALLIVGLQRRSKR